MTREITEETMFSMLEIWNKWSKGNEANTTYLIYLSSEIAAPLYLLLPGNCSPWYNLAV